MKQSGSSKRVIVVGGGHAGVEAAMAAARLGVEVVLVTHRTDRLGEMSCNPAIGGLGKGHLVREIDALDGVMGRAADAAGIQFRLLNRRKGPAVQGPRAQCDRMLYKAEIQRLVINEMNLEIVEGEVVDFRISSNMVNGVVLADETVIEAGAVVLTTGTFLRGVIHMGSETISGGRIDDPASTRLAETIDDLGLYLGRLKTGTPPRIIRSSIKLDILEKQDGDEQPTLFSFLSECPKAEQTCCWITHTNVKTHGIIRGNLTRSAMASGQISGRGPRYCPSIEDKITRFADRDSHQIFLEPEGLSSDLIYPNGISTSMPADVQQDFVRSIRGLENSEIARPGYAIEYDYVDPRGLDSKLRVRGIASLYLAGQINGTTGYEEAAAQGLVAGANAALGVLERPPLELSRSDAYIGVMIDDLVTRGVTEPYRMFTSRAEYRLALRADNADQRLTLKGHMVGLVGESRRQSYLDKMESMDRARDNLTNILYSPQEAQKLGVRIREDGRRRSILDLMAHDGFDVAKVKAVSPEAADTPDEILHQLYNDSIYAGYLERQHQDIRKLERDRLHRIPEDLSFSKLPGVSSELAEKLAFVRPENLDQASRIEGMTPSALLVIHAAMRRSQSTTS